MVSQTDNNVVFVHTGTGVISIRKKQLEFIDIEELFKIDYANIFGEKITASVFLNQLGLLKADLESEVKMSKINLEVFESQTRSKIEKHFISNDMKPTVQKIEDQLNLNPDVIKLRRHQIDVEKERDYVNSLFFSFKDKVDILKNIIQPILPEDVFSQIIEGTLNGCVIKKML